MGNKFSWKTINCLSCFRGQYFCNMNNTIKTHCIEHEQLVLHTINYVHSNGAIHGVYELSYNNVMYETKPYHFKKKLSKFCFIVHSDREVQNEYFSYSCKAIQKSHLFPPNIYHSLHPNTFHLFPLDSCTGLFVHVQNVQLRAHECFHGKLQHMPGDSHPCLVKHVVMNA